MQVENLHPRSPSPPATVDDSNHLPSVQLLEEGRHRQHPDASHDEPVRSLINEDRPPYDLLALPQERGEPGRHPRGQERVLQNLKVPLYGGAFHFRLPGQVLQVENLPVEEPRRVQHADE